MTDETDTESGEYMDLEEVPEDAMVLQCGDVVGSDGVIGRIDTDQFDVDVQGE